MKKTILLLAFCCTYLLSFAQAANGHSGYCYTDQIWDQMVRQDPSLAVRRRTIDENIAKMSALSPVNAQGARTPSGVTATVIPVVIYDVYDVQSANISMAQIQSQMDQLNLDFAAYGYTFCYAKRNVSDTSRFVPQAGDSAGVFRINSALSNVDINTNDAQLKALSRLPAASYLRIFIVHTITPQGVLGYALLPGSSTFLDGIVVRADVFGSRNSCAGCQLMTNYDLGATLTHEVGHYLGLYHTFQGGCDTGTAFQSCQYRGDWVCDTPPTEGTFGCPSPAPLSCNGVDHELIQNYMDYTHDPCKNSFTAGQKQRMDFSVLAYRQSLVSIENLIATGVTCADLSSQYANFNCINFNGCIGRPMTFMSLHAPGFTYSWKFGDGTTATGDTVQHIYSAAGQFVVQLTAISTSQGINATNSITAYITECHPITCPTNRWEAAFCSMDFSSGTAVATPHPWFADNSPNFYSNFHRGDMSGRGFFSIARNSYNSDALFDSLYHQIDSFQMTSISSILVPIPKRANAYCYLNNGYCDNAARNRGADSMRYYNIEMYNGRPRIAPGRRALMPPMPGGAPRLGNVNMLAIPSCDGSKTWILYQTAGNPIHIMSLDSTGLLTYHQLYTPAGFLRPKTMVASPDGRSIAVAGDSYLGNNCLFVLSFDKSTGTITGANTIYALNPAVSGAASWTIGRPCFSPNSRFLYQTNECCPQLYGNIGYIYQYDLASPNPYATRKVVTDFSMDEQIIAPYQIMVLGPDGKIYVCHETVPGNKPAGIRPSVINYPDRLETGLHSTGYNPLGPNIRPSNYTYPYLSAFGFIFMQDLHDATSTGCDYQPTVPRAFSYRPSSCLGYRFLGDDCYSSQWTFGDAASGAANSSTLSSPTHTFSTPGTYVVRQVTGGYTFTDTVRITAPDAGIAGTAINPCPVPYANYSISAIQPGVNYIWTVTHGTPATASGRTDLPVNWNPAYTSGTIMVIAVDTVMGCRDTATLTISYSVAGNTTTNNIADTICEGNRYPFHGQNLTAAGVYRDTVSTGGCLSVTVLTLAVVPGPAVTWTGGTVTLGGGSAPVTLSGGSPAGGTYSGSGVTAGVFYPASAAAGAHTISYTYTDAHGCSGTATRSYVITGISDLTIEEQIRLYPNPAQTTITAQSGLFGSTDVRMALYDISGRSISVPVTRTAEEATMNISSLSDGVYFIRFTAEGREAIKRFVKMK